MPKKLKNIGKDKKIKIMKLNKIRNEILSLAKFYVAENGWNENLFDEISKNSKYEISVIQSLFPEGYFSLIDLYLDEINNKMTIQSKNLNLIRLKVHERVRELCILRLSIMEKEKKIIYKTFMHILLPSNSKFCVKSLYKAVDQIWFLTGDSSTDFNFYSKRIILASIYSTTIIHFLNNNDIKETIKLLNKQLKKVSKIPKIKEKFMNISKLLPQLYKLRKNFSVVKQ